MSGRATASVANSTGVATVAEEAGTLAEEPGSVVEEAGAVSEEPGTVADDVGAVSEDPGRASEERAGWLPPSGVTGLLDSLSPQAVMARAANMEIGSKAVFFIGLLVVHLFFLEYVIIWRTIYK
jgi:hypothetical protein